MRMYTHFFFYFFLFCFLGHNYDPLRERAETQKLTKQLKREKKGAIKELRKDSAFIMNEKQKLIDAVKIKEQNKRREVNHWMQQQAFDSNVLRGKTKIKRTRAERDAQANK